MPGARDRLGAPGGALREHGLRVLVAAFGDPGHVYPAIALGRALRARGHEVTLETWEKWRSAVEGTGLEFAAAEQYRAFPPPPPHDPGPGSPAAAAKALLPLFERLRPDVVVNDILTLAPALAADVTSTPRVTLVPHLFPVNRRNDPIFALGFRPPRTPAGKAMWRRLQPVFEAGLRRGREEWNAMRAQLGLAPVERLHGGMSDLLTLVATFPQLEYPREWPSWARITGPMPFELPHPDIELPPGEGPLVLVAPSTSQDPSNRLIRSALAAFADGEARVVATTNHVHPTRPVEVPANAVLVDWLSYSQILPRAELAITHGGHGTVARCLSAGVPILTSPVAGDMNETAARITWAGAGRSVPWRLCGARSVRWAAGEILGNPRYAERAAEIAAWDRERDGADRGAGLIEKLDLTGTPAVA